MIATGRVRSKPAGRKRDSSALMTFFGYGYLIVLQVVSRAEGDSLTMYGLSKNLDWSSGISISLCGLNYLLEVEKIKLGYNDLLLIEYEEVTQEEFINLVNSFA